MPDSDDTAMVANLSHAFGYEATPLLESLLSFETDDPLRRLRPRTGRAR